MSDAPRIPPLPQEEWAGDVKSILELVPEGTERQLGDNNIFRTFARNPELFKSWLPLGGHLLSAGKLPGHDRELMILRTAVRCDSSYEWGQHVRISLTFGMDRAKIDRVAEGPDAEGWSDHEAALLRAADELHDTSRISDETWAALAKTYDEPQLMEATMLVGQYHLVAFCLNSFGVELDEGLESLPPETG